MPISYMLSTNLVMFFSVKLDAKVVGKSVCPNCFGDLFSKKPANWEGAHVFYWIIEKYVYVEGECNEKWGSGKEGYGKIAYGRKLSVNNEPVSEKSIEKEIRVAAKRLCCRSCYDKDFFHRDSMAPCTPVSCGERGGRPWVENRK